MRRYINSRKKAIFSRFVVTYMTAALVFAGFPLSIFAQGALSVDIQANGQNGTVEVVQGESWNYSWTSTSATACEIDTPTGTSGITLAGNDGPIPSEHPWYPAVGSSTTLTINCTDGTSSVSDAVTVRVVAAPTGGGGGGGSTSLSTDIKINGQDGTVTINSGDAWNYSWTSTDATACELVTPTGTSGITLAGNDGPIPSDHPWYPSTGGSTTLTISCTDGTDSVTDSATVVLATAGGGGGISADIKINGQDGTVTIAQGESWNYSWTSTSATACEIDTPTGTSGITLAGNDGPIPSDHPWYPAVGSSTTLTLRCTDGTNVAVDSAVVRIATGGGGGGISADIKINGQDGTATITQGESWNYSWTSTSATACELVTPTGTSGITLAGNDGPIPSDHPWYPDLNEITTLTLNCTDGANTATDSASVRVVAPTSGGGGGGGRGGGGSRSSGSVAGYTVGPNVVPVGNYCPFLTQYMRIDFNNNREQVARLQVFLQMMEGHNIAVTGVFDQATRQAVMSFQLKYSADVLAPWGINQPTGYVYITTLNKINELLCGPQPAYSLPQQQEIRDYVPPKTGAPADVGKAGKAGSKVGSASTSAPFVAIVGDVDPDDDKGQNVFEGLAAALFATPDTFGGLMQCLYELILILVVLYIIGTVLESVLYKDTPENVRKRFYTKWIAISAGLVLAMIGAYVLGEWCLLLPLLIVLIASIAWIAFYPKHSELRNSAKSWYIVGSARAKSMLKDTKNTSGSPASEDPKPATGNSSSQK